MADVEHCSGTQIHGVVHLLSEDQMTCLDKFEMGYNRIIVNSIDYQNSWGVRVRVMMNLIMMKIIKRIFVVKCDFFIWFNKIE